MSKTESSFIALRIEGGLFPAEFLARIASLDAPGQRPQDYGIPPGRTVRDEIGRYWSIAEALWKEYREQRKRTDIPAIRTGVERWLLRLLRDVFEYRDLTPVTDRIVIGERSFPISHHTSEGLSLLLTTADHSLDRPDKLFGDDNRRRAPHAAVQEYLNADPAALWGIVSNGLRIRFLRDNPSLTRPAYIEADLERIFEEGLYADFTALWLLGHASRFNPDANGVAGARMEAWRTEGAKTGQRALERLRVGVTTALRELGTGFVENPANEALRAALRDGTLNADGLHQQLLRLVYRLLLLFTAEERNLLHPPEAEKEARELYEDGYSLGRIRDRARFKRYYDQYGDLWFGLTVTFRALAHGAPALALPALGGLFDFEQCPDLDDASLSNTRLLQAIHSLAFFASDGALSRINYRDMGTEELGSVYESLLELHAVVQVSTRPWRFGFVGDDTGESAKGNERKLSGSYYTPDSLVQELLRSALDPVIEGTIAEHADDPRGALLRLRVLDPACGSGHFLLGAARRLADAVARLDAESDLPDEALRRHALREVVRRCIYGVDRNPLSVELCKTALWIEAIEPGKPLSFLDAHIKCGDSLVGVFDLKVLKDGIPDEAFKDLTGDDKTYSRDLRKRNKAERENPTLGLLPEVSLPSNLVEMLSDLTDAPEDTLEQVEAKQRTLHDLQEGGSGLSLRIACNLWCAAFFLPKAGRPDRAGQDLVPTTDTVWRYLRSPSVVYQPLIEVTNEVAERARFFHWPLEFPDVFATGGFDCVLGNPPWERIKLQEQEFFSSRKPEIAQATNKAERDRLIRRLRSNDADEFDRKLAREFESAKRVADAIGLFVRNSGRYPLSSVGDVNTFSLFIELYAHLVKENQRAGLIVPANFLTDHTTRELLHSLMSNRRLVSAFGFENEEFIFEGIANVVRFCLLTIGAQHSEEPVFCFYARSVEQANDNRRHFRLDEADISLFNPNTNTCPIFRTNSDLDLTAKIYKRFPILVNENTSTRSWPVDFYAMYHMALDSNLFVDVGSGATTDELSPVYEAKFIWQYDHRFSSYHRYGISKGRGGRGLPPTELSEYQDPAFSITPRWWVPEKDVDSRLRDQNWPHQWLIGWREVTSAKLERTLSSAVIPKCAVGNKYLLALVRAEPKYIALFLANINSIVLDYIARQKIGGVSMNYFIFKQLPFVPMEFYSEEHIKFIVPRVTELTFVADDVSAFARDVGYQGHPFPWEANRRASILAELDAVYAHLYGLSRDELRYILDPTDVYGSDFPSETFRVLKEKEFQQFGEYRTARLVLQAWDRFSADGTFASFGSGTMRTVA